ncbi:MAG: SiaB family protein kinase [Bacteroidia bacterium]
MNLDLTKNIYNKMVSHQFVMSIMGTINQDMLKSILKLTDKKLDRFDAPEMVRKRMFHFMIECAQNIYSEHESMQNNLLLIGKTQEAYIIYMGCMCNNDDIHSISAALDTVNDLNREELKATFYNNLKGDISGNSMLMSFLDIAKRTREKVHYEILEADPENKFLCLRSIIKPN